MARYLLADDVIMTSITVMRRWNAQAEILPSSTTRFFY
jgi:hypothetical protein